MSKLFRGFQKVCRGGRPCLTDGLKMVLIYLTAVRDKGYNVLSEHEYN